MELLYAKNIVKDMNTAVTQAIIRVNVCCRIGEGKFSPAGSKRDCLLSIFSDVVVLNVGR